jgi:putative DNA primase/helicase
MSVVASYVYSDVTLSPVARVDRIEPGFDGASKSFLPYLWNASKGRYNEKSGLNGTKLPLYRVDEVFIAIAEQEMIILVEGEGKCDALRAALRLSESRAAVTTIACGASATFHADCVAALSGAQKVSIIADSDLPGCSAASERAQRIVDAHLGCEVRVIDLFPDRRDGSDVKDFLEEGHSVKELIDMITRAPIVDAALCSASPAQVTVENGRRLELVRLSDVEPVEIEWLWQNRIPRSKVTLLVGDPGAGKSFACLAIAAAITNGCALPDDTSKRAPSSALLWNGEDGVEDTIRVRAGMVGAALDRLQVIRGTIDDEGRRAPFSLHDVARLRETIESAHDECLVIVDPVAALLGGVDAHRDNEVRATLQPLVELARDARVAVLCVLHLNKGEARRTLYRVGGSIGFVGIARSVLLAAVDPEDGRRAIAPLKANLSAPASPVEYRIDDEGRWWWGPLADDLSADYLLRSARRERAPSRHEAEDLLREALRNGPQPTKIIEKAAETAGIRPSALNRARKKLGVIADRVGGVADAGEWVLSLPKNPKSLTCASEGVRSLSNDEGEVLPL